MNHYIVIDGWQGRRRVPVEIVGRSKGGKITYVKVLSACLLPNRRHLERGDTARIPTRHIREGVA